MKISDKAVTEHLIMGGKIRRKDWTKGHYLRSSDKSNAPPTLVDSGNDQWTPTLAAIQADDWELMPLPPKNEFFQLKPEAKCFVERRHLAGNVDSKGYITVDRIYFVRHGHVPRFLEAQADGKRSVMEHIADLVVEGDKVIKNDGPRS